MAWLSAASIRWLQGSSRRMASAVSACTGLYCSGLAAPFQGLCAPAIQLCCQRRAGHSHRAAQ
ncbi:hypothetical protein GGI42DRAFT_322262 [Trichoderma sp. SZMC 28013]